jgi:hypothetical protein
MSLEPALADRLAKLLRVICDRSVDGETLAAAGRLSAIAAAHDLDWDRALNGGGPTRGQMQELYSAGYERGVAHTRQELRPERDWTPSGGSAEAGTDAERLRTILGAAAQSRDAGLLTDWEVTFTNDMRERFERFGKTIYISESNGIALID